MSENKNNVDYEYIQQFIQLHPDLKNKQIAASLGVSNYNVSYAKRRMKKHGRIPSDQISAEIREIKPADPQTVKHNLNPITYTTKLCVCRWHYEGDTIKLIGAVLDRPINQIVDILSGCIKSQEYLTYNRYNRDETTLEYAFKIIKKAYDMNVISSREEMEGAVHEFIKTAMPRL